jgi:type IV secretion system protein VirD4
MPDLFLKTARHRQKAGHRIYYFNPDDMSSDRINPIDTVRGVDDAQALARLIIDNTTGKNFGGDPFWPDSERQLLSVLIAHAKAINSHLGFVRELLNEGPDNLTGIIKDSPSLWAREQYRGFSNTAQEGVKRGVFSGLMTRLSLWTNPKIVALTEKTDPDLEALPDRLFTFYLAVPAHRPHMKPLAAMIFNYFLNLAQEKEFAHPLFLSLDEFTNFGVINAIASNLTIIRHRGIPAMIGIQDYIQLEEAYGRNDAQLLFNQPGFKAFYRPRDWKTAKQISDMLGRQTIVERKVTSSGQITEHERGRELLDPSELLALDTTKYIAFTPVTPPILVEKFTWRDYEAQTAEPPLPRLEIEIDDRIVKACAEARREPDWVTKPDARAQDGKKQSKTDSPDKKAKVIDDDWLRHSSLADEAKSKKLDGPAVEPAAESEAKSAAKSAADSGTKSEKQPVVEQSEQAPAIAEEPESVPAPQAVNTQEIEEAADEEKELLEAILGADSTPSRPQTTSWGSEIVEASKNDQTVVSTKPTKIEPIAPVDMPQAKKLEPEAPSAQQQVSTVAVDDSADSTGRGREVAKRRGRKRKIEIEDDDESEN